MLVLCEPFEASCDGVLTFRQVTHRNRLTPKGTQACSILRLHLLEKLSGLVVCHWVHARCRTLQYHRS
jgi:hypothetical protein